MWGYSSVWFLAEVLPLTNQFLRFNFISFGIPPSYRLLLNFCVQPLFWYVTTKGPNITVRSQYLICLHVSIGRILPVYLEYLCFSSQFVVPILFSNATFSFAVFFPRLPKYFAVIIVIHGMFWRPCVVQWVFPSPERARNKWKEGQTRRDNRYWPTQGGKACTCSGISINGRVQYYVEHCTHFKRIRVSTPKPRKS